MKTTPRDVFAEAKEAYTVEDAWRMLGLPGEPKRGNNGCPWRKDKEPSLSIYENGRKWKDHGKGEGGDLIAFIKAATDWSHAEIREWLMERLGIDYPTGAPVRPPNAPRIDRETEQERKEIQWPCELLTGTEATWAAFADQRGYSYAGVWTMVEAGVLRFGKVDAHKCFIVTDTPRRSAEIRRLDGGHFGESKAYPLRGVDKSWPVGAELLDPGLKVFVTEGCTDYLTGFDLLVRHVRAGNRNEWCPVGILGASVRNFDRGFLGRLRGNHARLCPDGDEAGDRMRESLTRTFTEAGVDVDAITLPRGKDLTDVKDEIQPEELFA